MVKVWREVMGVRKGTWTPEEDEKLVAYIQRYGHGTWRTLPKRAGVLRCGKSCRFRWMNYLRPEIKRGDYSKIEEETIIKLHQLLGNKWATIAARLPGRTDNEIKNYWHTHLKKRVKANQSMKESKQPSIEIPNCNVNTEEKLQSITDHIITNKASPQLSNNILQSIDPSLAKGEKYEEVDFQPMLEGTFNLQEDFLSTFKDMGIQFPQSPESFREFECFGYQFNQRDLWFNVSTEEELPYNF